MFGTFCNGSLFFGILYFSILLVDFLILRKATGRKAVMVFLAELTVLLPSPFASSR